MKLRKLPVNLCTGLDNVPRERVGLSATGTIPVIHRATVLKQQGTSGSMQTAAIRSWAKTTAVDQMMSAGTNSLSGTGPTVAGRSRLLTLNAQVCCYARGFDPNAKEAPTYLHTTEIKQ